MTKQGPFSAFFGAVNHIISSLLLFEDIFSNQVLRKAYVWSFLIKGTTDVLTLTETLDIKLGLINFFATWGQSKKL